MNYTNEFYWGFGSSIEQRLNGIINSTNYAETNLFTYGNYPTPHSDRAGNNGNYYGANEIIPESYRSFTTMFKDYPSHSHKYLMNTNWGSNSKNIEIVAETYPIIRSGSKRLGATDKWVMMHIEAELLDYKVTANRSEYFTLPVDTIDPTNILVNSTNCFDADGYGIILLENITSSGSSYILDIDFVNANNLPTNLIEYSIHAEEADWFRYWTYSHSANSTPVTAQNAETRLNQASWNSLGTDNDGIILDANGDPYLEASVTTTNYYCYSDDIKIPVMFTIKDAVTTWPANIASTNYNKTLSYNEFQQVLANTPPWHISQIEANYGLNNAGGLPIAIAYFSENRISTQSSNLFNSSMAKTIIHEFLHNSGLSHRGQLVGLQYINRPASIPLRLSDTNAIMYFQTGANMNEFNRAEYGAYRQRRQIPMSWYSVLPE